MPDPSFLNPQATEPADGASFPLDAEAGTADIRRVTKPSHGCANFFEKWTETMFAGLNANLDFQEF
jgi:hypothetical protein